MGGSSKQTVGYKYYLGAHLGICQGPVDYITEIEVDRRNIYCGTLRSVATASEGRDASVLISKPSVFGGDAREGGVEGRVGLIWGDETTAGERNSYLITQHGDDLTPLYGGVTSVVLEQTYVGNNPYLKPWAFKVQRIERNESEGDPWLAEFAACGPNAGDRGFDCATLTALLEQGNGNVTEVADNWTDPASTEPLFSTFIPTAYSDQGLVLERITGLAVTDWASDYDVAINPYPDSDGYDLCGFVDPTPAGWVVEMSQTAPGGNDAAIYEKSLASINAVTHKMAAVCASASGDGALAMNRWLDAIGRYETTGTQNGSKVDQRLWVYSGRNGGVSEQLGTSFTVRYITEIAGVGTDTGTDIQFDVPYIEPGTICYVTVQTTRATTFSRWEYDSSTIAYDFYRVYLVVAASICVRLSDGTQYAFDDERELYCGLVRVDIGTTASFTLEDSTGPTQSNFRGYPSILNSGAVYLYGYLYGNYVVDTAVNMADVPSCGDLVPVEDGPCGTCADMNPAHIVRECLTNTTWGLGYTANDIDDASFSAAAQTLFNEQMCLSFIWDKESTIEEFVSEVLRHIDAALYVSRATGQFVLKLIREEGDSNTLILDETNVSEVSDLGRPAVSELTNKVTVVYWENQTDIQEAVSVHNEALRQIQGREISTTIQYPGCPTAVLARVLALRDLQQLSVPRLRATIEANQEAEALNIGDVFYFSWPDLDVSETLMRVNEIDYGDGRDNTITIEAVEDIFGTPAEDTDAAQGTLWVDPQTVSPDISTPRLLVEAPYYTLAQQLGEWETIENLSFENRLGYMLVAGGRQGGEFAATFEVDSGAGYSEAGGIDFAPYAYLDADVNQVDQDFPIVTATATDLDGVTLTTLAQVGSEVVQVVSIDQDSAGAYVNVGVLRGVLDTVPVTHTAGEAIIFFEDYAETDGVQYVEGDEINVKLRPLLQEEQVALADAPADSLAFAYRATRQFPPGNFRIDGLYYPEQYIWTGSHVLTWNHRSYSLLAFGGVFGHAEAGDVQSAGDSPEYIVEAYALVPNTSGSYDRVKVYEENVGNVLTHTLELSSIGPTDSNLEEMPGDAEFIDVEVKTLERGFLSWQSATVRLEVRPFTSSVGDSVGDSIGDSVGFVSVGDSIGPWSPSEISSLLLWLDAADTATITHSSNAVTNWADKSGNGHDASPGLVAERPSTNTVTRNGLNVIDFDGNDDQLNAGTLGGKPASFTAYIVAETDDVTKTNQSFATSASAGGVAQDVWPAFILRGSAQGEFEAIIGDGTDYQQYRTTDGPITQSVLGVHGIVYSNGDTDIDIYSPDVLRSKTDLGGSGSSNSGTAYDFVVGNLGVLTSSNFHLDGKVAEIVIYDRVLSQSERQRVEGYLAHKWGREGDLDAAHPYKSVPPQSGESVA